MVLLENETFLLALTKMFQKSRTSQTGSVSMTVKKYDGRDRPVPKNNPRKSKKGKGKDKKTETKNPPPSSSSSTPHHQDTTVSCLLRAKLHTSKISTIVLPKDVNRFQIAYSNLLKGNMDGLKKAKKVKGKTSKAT